MPGVITRTAVRTGPTPFEDDEAATFFVTGLTERGPVDRVSLLRSMSDYMRTYGDRVAYGSLYDQLQTYFEEGGVRAYVARVVGDASSIGTLELDDRAVAPLPLLAIDAAGPGAWSTDVTVEVTDGVQDDTFNMYVRYAGDMEQYLGLVSAAEAAAVINTNSAYVRATALANATAAPNNIPAVMAATPLSPGADDRAAVVSQNDVDALDMFPKGLGVGMVAIPGQLGSAVSTGVIAHCKANNRIAALAAGITATEADAIAMANTVRAGTTNSEHVGLFFPWVEIPSEDGSALTRTISPEGYVAGVRARAIIEDGPWRAPAGEIAAARYVLAPSRIIDREAGDNLDANEVSAIRVIAGSTRLYGWRSLSPDESNWALLTGRDTMNLIVDGAERRLEKYVFRTIDGRGLLFAEIKADMIAFLDPIRAAGGLYETDADLGYSVDTGPSVNTQATLLTNNANVAIAGRVSPTGATIGLLATKVGVGASV